MIDYRKYDDRLQKGKRLKKIKFANNHGYKYWTQFLHEKHKEGLTPGQIADYVWSEFNKLQPEEAFRITVSGINYSLKAINVFTPKYKNPGYKPKKNTPVGGIKKIKKSTERCTRPGCTNMKAPGNRFLCSVCFKQQPSTEDRHGNVNASRFL